MGKTATPTNITDAQLKLTAHCGSPTDGATGKLQEVKEVNITALADDRPQETHNDMIKAKKRKPIENKFIGRPALPRSQCRASKACPRSRFRVMQPIEIM